MERKEKVKGDEKAVTRRLNWWIKPDYGISGANKHYKDDSPYLVKGNEWEFEKDRVIRLMRDKA